MPLSPSEIAAIEKEHQKVLKEQARYYKSLKKQYAHNRRVSRQVKRDAKKK